MILEASGGADLMHVVLFYNSHELPVKYILEKWIHYKKKSPENWIQIIFPCI